MTKGKAKKLVLDDEDEDWDEFVQEEEEDDIIDEEEDEEDIEDGDLSEEEEMEDHPRKRKKKMKKKPSGGFFSHPGVKWTGRVLITLIIVFILFAPLKPFTDMREATGIDSLKNLMRPYRNFPEWVNVTMKIDYDVTVRYGQAQSVDIQVAIPFDIPQMEAGNERNMIVQDVEDVEITPDPTEGIIDFNTEYNHLSGWKLNDLNAGPYQFTATYDMKLYTHEWDMTNEESGTIEDIPQEYKDKYLGDAWPQLSEDEPVDNNADGIPDHYRYNPSDPEITSIAESLTKDEPTVLGKVRAIYDWIKDNFNYTTSEQRIRDQDVYGDLPKWATGCLNDRYGDCDDQSLLMASLCRSVDIPAWLEIGYLYDQMKQEWGGHGWFNVIIPKNDGSGHVIAPIDPVNSEFLFRDPFRITDWIDNGSYIKGDKGNDLYNLDDYYNFFSQRSPGFVEVDIDAQFIDEQFEKVGNIKRYVDQKIEPGNLQGTDQEIPQLPALNPLVALPLALVFLAIPACRSISRKREG